MAGYSDFFRRRSSQAQSFLSSGSVNYNPLPVVGSNRTGCFDSSGCASGWACVGGICVEEGSASRSGSGNTSGCGGGGADGSLPGECGAGNTTYLRLDKDLAEVYQKALNNLRPGDVLLRTALDGGTIGNGLIGLSLNGKCLKTGCSGTATTLGTNDACCGAGRCCRYSGFGVQCYCGGCPPPLETCSKFCTAYQASNGVAAAGCTAENTCDECESCGSSGCVPKTSGPCWCENGSCGRCEACAESGTCVDDSANCVPTSPDPDPDPDPSPVDPCAGTCSTITVCGDQPAPPCPPGSSCRTSGTITVGDRTCTLTEICDKNNVPDECKDCDCNCNDDCPDCKICNDNGNCEPDPVCTSSYFTEYAWVKETCRWGFTWAIGQPQTCIERSCPGLSEGAVSIETANRGMTDTDVMGLSWGGEILDPFICNNNGCPDIEPPRRISKEVLLDGAPTGDSAWVSFSSCPGSFFSSIQISYYEVGVAVGVGATQAEADQAASENLPSAGF